MSQSEIKGGDVPTFIHEVCIRIETSGPHGVDGSAGGISFPIDGFSLSHIYRGTCITRWRTGYLHCICNSKSVKEAVRILESLG